VCQRFKKEVVGYFLKEYAAGRTPNPCVFCNENFKFKILFETAEKNGAKFVATGHYARIKKDGGHHRLFEAKDKKKNQAYFLYRLKQVDFKKIIFPLGEYEKERVKKIAKQLGFLIWKKKESQDVCFVCKSTYDFLKNNLKLQKGQIVNEKNEIIGRHEGLALYTLGQRKGIRIGGTGPYYVVGKDFKKNQLIVSHKKSGALFSEKTILEKVNWISETPELPKRILVQTRYRILPVYATINKDRTRYSIRFEKMQRAVTPGQSAVFLSDKGEILGGGIIKK
jgi:tRNA-uridine 2-sulfurtransferase